MMLNEPEFDDLPPDVWLAAVQGAFESGLDVAGALEALARAEADVGMPVPASSPQALLAKCGDALVGGLAFPEGLPAERRVEVEDVLELVEGFGR